MLFTMVEQVSAHLAGNSVTAVLQPGRAQVAAHGSDHSARLSFSSNLHNIFLCTSDGR